MFVKEPKVGTVKTRLAEKMGAEGACLAYIEMVERLLVVLRGFDAVTLYHTPTHAGHYIRKWSSSNPSWKLREQLDGDLGRRLRRAFLEEFASGEKKVIVIGSDCPSILASDITSASDLLNRRDVVVGPAVDGGYWLIGMRSPHMDLFESMPWSRATLFDQTWRRARTLGLSRAKLRTLADIDTIDDWNEWKGGPFNGGNEGKHAV